MKIVIVENGVICGTVVLQSSVVAIRHRIKETQKKGTLFCLASKKCFSSANTYSA